MSEQTLQTAQPIEQNMPSDAINPAISSDEYKEFQAYQEYKKMKEIQEKLQTKELTPNQEVARDQEIIAEKQKKDQKAIKLADEIESLNSLSRKHLSKRFHRETLLAKYKDLDRVILEQKRGLVAKFISKEDIMSASKTDNIDAIEDGPILDLLVNMAKTRAKNKESLIVGSKNNVESLVVNPTSQDYPNINDPYFDTNNYSTFENAVRNAQKIRIMEKHGNIGLQLFA